jgi:DNA-binding NarL/FixJ family response regulator
MPARVRPRPNRRAKKEMQTVAKPTVLVADDHVVVLARVLSLLANSFDVVGTARDGKDLITQAQRLHPDVIVLDITMPQLNGVAAAHKLRELGSTAKLVFLTVNEGEEFIEACFAEGALAYVTKARMTIDLIPAIERALTAHRFISQSTNC